MNLSLILGLLLIVNWSNAEFQSFQTMYGSRILCQNIAGGISSKLSPRQYFEATVGLQSRSWFEISWLVHHRHYNLIGRDPEIQRQLDHRMVNCTPDNLKDRFLGDQKFNLTPNEFPYWIQENVEHQILWSDQDRNPSEIDRHLEMILDQPYLWFRNPINLQSVPSIFHVQVFTNREKFGIDFNLN